MSARARSAKSGQRSRRNAFRRSRRPRLESLESRRLLASILVSQTGSTEVSERGTASDTFSVRLDEAPASDVVIEISGGDVTEATIDKSSLTFDNGNWFLWQVVTVTAVDDTIVDRDQTPKYTISVDVANSDPAFASVADEHVLATVLDDDAITLPVGQGLPHQNMQPSLVTNYIISNDGIYPNRDNGPLAGEEQFYGEVRMFGGNFAPRGWYLAQGQLLDIASNVELFSLLGTTYGGDGRMNFGIPDLRGRAPIGAGSGPGLSPQVPGQKQGDERVSLTNTLNLIQHAHTTTDPAASTSPTGSGVAHTNMQPTQGIRPIISIGFKNFDLEPRMGEVRLFAGNFAPGGWAFAEGQLLSPVTNSSLFSQLGTTYGGDGESTFALPDLRGRLAVGSGTGPGLSNVRLGAKSGTETSVDAIGSHSHLLPQGGSTESTSTTTSAAGNRQPQLGLRYMIALSGLFPSRSILESGNEGPEEIRQDPFIGEIALTANVAAPVGWAFAQGQLLPIPGNEALFSILGTTYGGDGETTFALPDLRGRAAIGSGNGPGLTPRAIGQRFGVEEVVLSPNELPSHTHRFAANGMLVVDTLVDELDGDRSAGDFSLREAIEIASPDGGFDTITFHESLAGGTIQLDSAFGPLYIARAMKIDASALSGLTIDAGDGTDGVPGTGDGFRGFSIDAGNVHLTGLTITGGDTNDSGGAILSVGSLSLDGTSIVGNRSAQGGAIWNSGELTLRDSNITGNTADGDGGGIVLSNNATMTVTDSSIVGNTADGSGGGILLSDNAIVGVTDSSIVGNTADGSGGGIYAPNTAPAAVTNSTISGNTAGDGGGGIYSFGSVRVTNSTITGNTADRIGGGLYASGAAVNNSTIVDNLVTSTASEGGGGIFAGGSLQLYNSIVGGNQDWGLSGTPFHDLAGVAASGESAGNLIGDPGSSGGLVRANNILGDGNGNVLPLDEIVLPLGDYGGPTLTHPPVFGGPAVDAGNASLLPPDTDDLNGDDNLAEPIPFDQTGSPRVQMGGLDIGAFEVGEVVPKVEGVVINGGDVQRSSLTTVQVTFDTEIHLGGSGEDPFQFHTVVGAIEVIDDPVVSVVDSKTVVDFTFLPGLSVEEFGSLADGDYELIVAAGAITVQGRRLDGNGDGTEGDDHAYGDSPLDDFFRKYGDQNGNDLVELFDFAAFRGTFGLSSGDSGYIESLDSNGDDTIDLFDFAAFRGNFGS